MKETAGRQMTVEAVPLGYCQKHNCLQTFHWLDASQAAAVAFSCSIASPPVADEHDLHAQVKKRCRVTGAG